MIEPTVGRIVWVYAGKEQSQPMAAIITSVKTNENITVSAFDGFGVNFPISDLKLLQTDADYKGEYPYATWMPYQKGQAAKTEQLEKKIERPGEASYAKRMID